jgi:CDP-diacylglycerol--glycerol-3-phosphate 3-phosphatidyltransferase
MTWIPWAMVWLRVALCPAIVLGAWRGWPGEWLGGIVLLALVDDILDGMVARRMGCDTPAIRLADSVADTIFYLGVAAALWLRAEAVLRGNWILLATLGGLELTRYGFDFWKFGKGASYHSYLAKGWGLVMAVAVIGALSFGGWGWMIRVSIVVGIAANCEGLAMSLMLPRWQNDVKTLGAAWRLRGEMRRVVPD